MNDTPQFFDNPFKSTYCEMFNCTNKADLLIGRPQDGALAMPGSMRICNSCARSVIQKLPDRLLAHADVEKAISLLDEEQKDALFDRLFPPAEPKELLENLLTTMDGGEIDRVLVSFGYSKEAPKK
mgnify:CR=1 FL=1